MDYTEALVESSGFYEPFFFRGIYMVTNHENRAFVKIYLRKKLLASWDYLGHQTIKDLKTQPLTDS